MFKILLSLLVLSSCASFNNSKEEKFNKDVETCLYSVIPLVQEFTNNVDASQIANYCVEVIKQKENKKLIQLTVPKAPETLNEML